MEPAHKLKPQAQGHVAQLVECLPNMNEDLDKFRAPHKLSVVKHTCNSSP